MVSPLTCLCTAKSSAFRSPGKEGTCWFNCAIPRFSAKLHCTFKELSEKPIRSLVEDAHQMVFSHEIKATGIRTQEFDFPEKDVSGVLYTLTGPVASPLQFFATDSTNRFLRGSLYFDHSPNPTASNHRSPTWNKTSST